MGKKHSQVLMGRRKKPFDAAGVYDRLYAAFGPQDWWPADSALEMITGAVLTQNTAWVNVVKAMDRLKAEGALRWPVLHEVALDTLAEWIRPCGYFNLKARRLRALTSLIAGEYGGRLEVMLAEPADRLREALLGVWGIGPETADSIVLYAAERPVFVVDAYTRRMMERHEWLGGGEPYDEVAARFTGSIPAETAIYNEFHALIVRLAKRHCHARNPDCGRCPLQELLPGDSHSGGKPL